jgi:hypothetical protein
VKAVRPDPDDLDLRNYLLGLLPEADAEALEDAYLARPEVWERLRGVEDDLLDDHASDRLSPDDKTAFEKRYLASASLRARVSAARALRRAIADLGPAPAAAGLARPHRAPWLAIAAGLLLASVAVWRWPPVDRPPNVTSLPSSIAAARLETPPPAREAPATPVILALSPILLRGQQRPTEWRIPPGTETVVLELEGDPAVLRRSASTLEALVKTVEGGPVWRGAAARVVERARPSLLAVARVPRARLEPGDYLVTLSDPGTDDAALFSYFFRVSR